MKEAADTNLEQAKEGGDVEEIERQSKRAMRVTSAHNDECKKLLRLMGVPVVEAPCEAEATCAELSK